MSLYNKSSFLYTSGGDHCLRFSDPYIYKFLRAPVLLHPFILGDLLVMSKDMWVLCAFSRSKRDLRSSKHHPSQNEIGERQRVQRHVTRGTCSEMRLEVGEAVNKALVILIQNLSGAPQTSHEHPQSFNALPLD